MNRIVYMGRLCLLSNHSEATQRTIDLIVDEKTVNFTGQPVNALTINHQIPGPTLHFKEGDQVTIHVYNHLNRGTSLHWHGLLVPWQLDGVTGISQKAIPPGKVAHYRFTVQQSGSYWYHGHDKLQEQQGLYGGIVIDPSTRPSYRYHKDFVVILSDWNNANPEKVYANLKKNGDYYTPRFPLQPSLLKFIHDYRSASLPERKQLIHDYKMMQRMRMSLYDLSDVAYDAYLLNGQTAKNPWSAAVKVGDIVRLRFIGAGSSTTFHVKIPQALMKIVQVDGNNVKPVTVNKLSIAPGETYDVLVMIKKRIPYIIYAESMDTLGNAVGAMTTAPHQYINYQAVKPFPEPKPVTREIMENRMSTGMDPPSRSSLNKKMNPFSLRNASATSPMRHPVMSMSKGSTLRKDSIVGFNPFSGISTSPSTKYQPFVAAVKTNDPKKPIKGVIQMELSGYMDRYIWFINGVPGYKAKPIVLQPQQ